MARKLRIQYPGAIYHVLNGGAYREGIFLDKTDRQFFLQTLGQACARTDWRIHAWCLTKNLFHLVVETPKANLSEGMKWLLGAYTIRFNLRHKLFGQLFRDRYKTLIVEGGRNDHFKGVCDFAHFSPIRTSLVGPRQKLSDYPWSSYADYLKGRRARPPWLQVDRLLAAHGIAQDSPAGRKRFEQRMEMLRAAEKPQKSEKIPRGWYRGSKAFRKELLARMKNRRGTKRDEEATRESAQKKAQRIVRKELKQLGWTERELSRRRKGDANKVRIALRLRRDTTMTYEWIAQRLKMGTKEHVSHLVYWRRRDGR